MKRSEIEIGQVYLAKVSDKVVEVRIDGENRSSTRRRWAQLSVGFGIALGLCLLAALWPAISTGRAEPLRLLQAGRAAM
jgi:putative ABC transport system permease protein